MEAVRTVLLQSYLKVWWVLVVQDILVVAVVLVAVLCIEPSSVLKAFPPGLYKGLPLSLMPSSRLHG